jgi:GTP pyrophosphokinase
MRKQNITFIEVYDLLPIRVILDAARREKTACWRVYSIVTDFYQLTPTACATG